ncbi:MULTISPECIES: helix-turn-helix domain-containing protein [Nocardia]|uniref:XRE family transcriptional regulator n=1 Tax=Nocardia nova TaxID=37330 RepID=A0A2T2YWH8_9NOCA|nr:MULTISPECIES: helix-turn-helix transcriptional regulator [Nocardia]PSR59877.1 XRE family transcriptional regulator [Nocardia nova]
MPAQTTTLPRRLLARRLVELRETAKLTRDKAAQLSEISTHTLWRLETGQGSQIKKIIIRALCDVYEATEDDRTALLWLAEQSRKEGWWQSYSEEIVNYVGLFIGLEQSARRITSFQLTLLPGLVQTAEYRRAIALAFDPGVTDEEIERHVELLTKRQRRLEDSTDDFTLDVMLSEAALRHHIGGRAVMADQVSHLIDLANRPNVSISLVPLTTGGYLGLQAGSFVLLEFPHHPNPALTEPPVAYVEGYTGALYLDKSDEIEQYRAAVSSIRNAALSATESRALLQAVLEEYRA